jgi:hypothetical protein
MQEIGISLFTLPGMDLFEMALYRDWIREKKPDVVILYVSDFDFGREPRLSALIQAPPQGVYLATVLRRLQPRFGYRELGDAVLRRVFRNLFPEVTYHEIFRALARAAFGRVLPERFVNPPPATVRVADQAWFELVMTMNNRDLQAAFFEDFLRSCQSEGIKVLILEGQYHPAVRSPRYLPLRRWVRSEMRRLTRLYRNVRFLPSRKIYRFQAGDYKDVTHVNKRAAQIYLRQLESYLLSHNAEWFGSAS